MFRRRIILFFTIITAACSVAVAQQTDSVTVIGGDTILYRYTPIEKQNVTVKVVSADTTAKAKRPNFLKKILNYFAESSTDKTFEKKIDFSFVGGPYYSNSTSVGIGLLAAGLYRIDKENRDLPASSVSLFANASITGFYKIGIEGTNIFKNDQHRLLYNLQFYSQPIDFWGVGYEAAMNNLPKSYLANRYQIEVKYDKRICRNLYAGAMLNVDYAYSGNHTPYSYRSKDDKANDVREPLPEGQKSHYSATGISLFIEYDSRDFIPNPSRGIYLSVREMWRPKPLSSIGSHAWMTKVIANYYQRLWKDCILALDLYGEFNSQSTPWTFYAQMGGTWRMRGYYEGRFSDLNTVMFQAELRQRVWRRIGITVWGGAGNVFHSFSKFDWGHTMPNYGIGARWEFKNRVNIRLDYGFGGKDGRGKLINGFLMSVNEAF